MRRKSRQGSRVGQGCESAMSSCGISIESELVARIGRQRFEVWFGGSVRLRQIACGIVVESGDGFVLDWIRKTFRSDLEAVARSVCGPEAGVLFRCDDAESVTPRTAAAEVRPEEPATPKPVEPVEPAKSVQPRGRVAVREIDGGVSSASETSARKQPVRTAASSRGEGMQGSKGMQGSESGAREAASGPGSRRGPRFGPFIAGESNRMAMAAIDLMVQRPGEISPLLIQGPSGVGKTHLLEQCCHRARERHPGISAVFLSAEQFTTNFLQALHGGGLPAFRRNCRNVDLLVIDDLQFFVGKRATTVEFQQTIDALQRQTRQLVVSCDRDLCDLGDLGDDLVQRLSGGMSARIAPPDAEVRRGIVLAIADRKQLALPDDVVEFVVTHMTRTARELAGAVNRLEATSHMLGVPVTRGLAEEALADLVRASVRSVRLADIERAVCSAFGLESGSLQSCRRAKRVNHPRMLAMFLARKHTPAALTEIGSYFGRRSHSTVISAHKTVASWVSSRSTLQIADARWDADEAIRRVEDLLRTGS